MFRYLLPFWFALAGSPVGAQPIVAFRNASLEGEPRANSAPHDWYYCNFPGESPPDIHPKGLYRVELPAHDGTTYVGLVCRDNGSFESIGQHLPAPLPAGSCFRWRARVARSRRYRAISRSSLQPDSFAGPVRLALFGGSDACDREVVLGWSDTIGFSAWQPTEVILRVSTATEHLRIGLLPVGDRAINGHVLLDAIEPLLPCDCTSGSPLRTVPVLAPLATPDWAQLAAQLDRHIRSPRSGIVAFRHRDKTYQGLAVLAQVAEYLHNRNDRLDIGIRLGDRAAFRTIRQQLRYRLDELELTEKQFRFKRIKSYPGTRWIGADSISILYLRPR